MRVLLLPLLLIACGDAENDKDDTVATPTDSHVNTSSLTNAWRGCLLLWYDGAKRWNH